MNNKQVRSLRARPQWEINKTNNVIYVTNKTGTMVVYYSDLMQPYCISVDDDVLFMNAKTIAIAKSIIDEVIATGKLTPRLINTLNALTQQ